MMAQFLVTGSVDGLGRATAVTFLADGNTVIVHARSRSRADALRPLLDRGAELLVADFTNRDELLAAAQELNGRVPLDGVVHNAGVISGRGLMPVNVVAPYFSSPP